jgi:protein dithiol oxidoreductase (disulfide-forming)
LDGEAAVELFRAGFVLFSTGVIEMKRREMNALSAMGLVGAAMALPTLSQAQAKKFEEGTDFLALDKPVAVDAPAGKVEIIEFFWYSCPHCNAFEPALEAWIKRLPADVSFRRVPIAFRDSFVPQQRLFYTLEAMGKVDALQLKVFNAIHVEKQTLDTQETIVAWAAKQGIDKTKFLEVFNSFGVATKTRKAKQLQDAFKIDGVPSLGVAGRFYTDGTLAKTMERALQVTEYLVTEARKLK